MLEVIAKKTPLVIPNDREGGGSILDTVQRVCEGLNIKYL